MNLKQFKHIRTDKNESILSLAGRTGIGRHLIRRIETDTGNPEFKTVVKLASALGYELVLMPKNPNG